MTDDSGKFVIPPVKTPPQPTMPKDHHRDVVAKQPGAGKSEKWRPSWDESPNPVFGGKK